MWGVQCVCDGGGVQCVWLETCDGVWLCMCVVGVMVYGCVCVLEVMCMVVYVGLKLWCVVWCLCVCACD